MSLKPIDYQVMLPKANEVSRDISGQASKYNAIQRQQADRIKEDAEEELKQVRDRESIRNMRIGERESDRSGQQEKKQNKKQGQEAEKETRDSNGKGITIDIRL
jgi:hypothetical protein